MKLRILGAIAAVGAVLALFGGTAQAAPGPQDHSYTVSFSTYANGANPNVTVSLTLGTGTPAGAPHPTSFFDQATTTYSGLTPATPPNLGSEVGSITFTIQSNVNPALLGTNNIKADGQPPRCGEAGTLSFAPLPFTLLAARKQVSGASVVSTAANPGNPPYSFDQEADDTAGGVPKGVTHIPDWYAPVLGLLGVPDTLVVARSWGVAKPLSIVWTSVNFLTINTTGGIYAAVTILGNPISGFNPAAQTQTTCAPFSSTVSTQGTSTAKTWNCTGTDYHGAAFSGGCAGTTAGTAYPTTAITGANATTHNYQIALSSAANVDNDFSGAIPLYAAYDNCKVDANATQTDANSNGIGDACKAGGSWANAPTAGAVANASLTCGAVAIAPPWNACQDADGDDVLNFVDNCPLHANPTQLDADSDGIGDACDPAPFIDGKGGSAPGAVPGVVTVGEFKDYDDLCNHPFTVGTGHGASSCINTLAEPTVVYVDSNDNGVPDFLNPGAGVPCAQDHRSDSNLDGYSDSDQATTAGSKSCTGAFPAAGGLGQDPMRVCAGRTGSWDGTGAAPTNVLKARADVNLDGNINILDLSALSGQFLQAVSPSGLDFKHEMDLNKDSNVNILDLSTAAGFFLNPVPAC